MTKADKIVHLLNPERFDEVFEIMKSSFPEDEYRTYEEQKALLAVSPAFRNAGLGSHMFCETLEKIAKTVIFDVEVPDSEITKRRVGFYNNLLS